MAQPFAKQEQQQSKAWPVRDFQTLAKGGGMLVRLPAEE
jgi:hypothetical protein